MSRTASDVNCPYCGTGQEICHDDGYGLDEENIHEQECSACERTFAYKTLISLSYIARRADCLNGSEHDWRPITVIPPIYPDAKECAACGARENGQSVSVFGDAR